MHNDREKPARVVHMSSLHFPFEPRIYLKECQSLAKHGYDVKLVTPSDVDGVFDGVTIIPVSKVKNRLHRLFVVAPSVAFKSWKQKPDIFHFHDTMMLPWALIIFLISRKPIIYDIHEDNVTGIKSKPYLPKWVSGLLAAAYAFLEQTAVCFFEVIIAERYYESRFPRNTPVLNYLADDTFEKLMAIPRQATSDKQIRLLYAGTAAIVRGAEVMAELARLLPSGSEVHLIGRCDLDVAKRIREIEPNENSLKIIGCGRHVPFDEIVDYYGQPWTAALALFPEDPHVINKELTKFFEYMAAGLPIVCSDFPVWRELVTSRSAGICVNVNNVQHIADTIVALGASSISQIAYGRNGRRAASTTFRWST